MSVSSLNISMSSTKHSKMNFLPALIYGILCTWILPSADGASLTSGKFFVVAFPPLDLSVNEASLYISALHDSQVNVSVPGRPTINYNIASMANVNHTLIVNKTVLKQAIIIRSNNDVTVTAFINSYHTITMYEIFAFTPDSNEFYFATPKVKSIENGSRYFIIAAYDTETNVSVSSTAKDRPGDNYNFHLKPFEVVYQSLTDDDWSSYHVISNHPISVYAEQHTAMINDFNRGSDDIVITPPPVKYLGTDFILPPTDGLEPTLGYGITLVASQDNSTCTISTTDYNQHYKLNKGDLEHHTTALNNVTTLIACSAPTMVIQYAQDRNIGDSFYYLIPPVDRYTHENFIFYVPEYLDLDEARDFQCSLTIIARSKYIPEISFKSLSSNELIPPAESIANWKRVPGKDGYFYKIFPLDGLRGFPAQRWTEETKALRQLQTNESFIVGPVEQDVEIAVWLYGHASLFAYSSLLTYSTDDKVRQSELTTNTSYFHTYGIILIVLMLCAAVVLFVAIFMLFTRRGRPLFPHDDSSDVGFLDRMRLSYLLRRGTPFNRMTEEGLIEDDLSPQQDIPPTKDELQL